MARYGDISYKNIDYVYDIDLNTGSDACSDGDLLSEPQAIPNAVHRNGTSTLQFVRLANRGDKNSAVDIIFMNQNTPLGTDNAALVTSDGDLSSIETIVPFSAGDYTDMGSFQIAVKNTADEGMGALMKPSDPTTDTLYVASVSRDTDIYDSNGINLRIGFMRR